MLVCSFVFWCIYIRFSPEYARRLCWHCSLSQTQSNSLNHHSVRIGTKFFSNENSGGGSSSSLNNHMTDFILTRHFFFFSQKRKRKLALIWRRKTRCWKEMFTDAFSVCAFKIVEMFVLMMLKRNGIYYKWNRNESEKEKKINSFSCCFFFVSKLKIYHFTLWQNDLRYDMTICFILVREKWKICLFSNRKKFDCARDALRILFLASEYCSLYSYSWFMRQGNSSEKLNAFYWGVNVQWKEKKRNLQTLQCQKDKNGH